MSLQNKNTIQKVFPASIHLYPDLVKSREQLSSIPEFLAKNHSLSSTCPYIQDLARLELALFETSFIPYPELPPRETCIINPSLQILQVNWKNLEILLEKPSFQPEQGEAVLLIYRKKDADRSLVRSASNRDLLAIKIVVEQLDMRSIAAETGVSIQEIDQVLIEAVNDLLIMEPASKLVRPPDFPRGVFATRKDLFKASYFTLQWHITQKCDMTCRHCYDRSERMSVSYEQGMSILEQLDQFTQSNHIRSQVTFTGGNPLLHPHFFDFYTEAVNRGFLTAILGNPVPRDTVSKIISIRKPEFFQISIEGLQGHNDYIRGRGSFKRAIDFLEILKDLDVSSMVMLTLTRENESQVLQLAKYLKDRTDLFTFNRLALVGAGTSLESANADTFRDFLTKYQLAASEIRNLGFKDSMFNILRYEKGQSLLGGCTGFGCGAAFNFVSLLPDGEVHACRKFPSQIGNIHKQDLKEIYDSSQAVAYRRGSSACDSCAIRPLCGGCLAVSYGLNKDIFREKDPYCFFDK